MLFLPGDQYMRNWPPVLTCLWSNKTSCPFLSISVAWYWHWQFTLMLSCLLGLGWGLGISKFFYCCHDWSALFSFDQDACSTRFCCWSRDFFKTAAMLRIYPLCLVSCSCIDLSLRKKYPPTLLLSFGSERYDASLWLRIVILISQYRIVALGWVPQ